VGVVIVAAVIIDGPAEQPAPGLHGDRLGVLLALAAFAVGLLGELEQTRAAQVQAAALSERQHLAREMHDVLAHSLSALTLQLEEAGCWRRPSSRTADGSPPPWSAPTTWPRPGCGTRGGRSARCATRSCRDRSG
jgi:hypothetical protein